MWIKTIKKRGMVTFCIFLASLVIFIFLSKCYQIMLDVVDDYTQTETITTHKINNSHLDSFLKSHPVFSKFNVSVAPAKKRVDILIIVSSAPKRCDRRQAIRETYWRDCKRNGKVIPECVFMTDYQSKDSFYHDDIKNEMATYGDLRFQNLKGGIQFGLRYLHSVLFAFRNYNFEYMLRLDDDYFFCMKRFLHELPLPMVPRFHWGWTHCIDKIVRPEESVVLFSRDLLILFLTQDQRKMKCHPLADQMIALWSQDLKLGNIFHHDSRLHHTPIVSKEPALREDLAICSNFIGIHGSYPADMRLLWNHRGNTSNYDSNLLKNSKLCRTDSSFKWRKLHYIYRYEPQPCIRNPVWDTSKLTTLGGAYTGRQENNLVKGASEQPSRYLYFFTILFLVTSFYLIVVRYYGRNIVVCLRNIALFNRNK